MNELSVLPISKSPASLVIFVNGYWNSGESTAGEEVVARIVMPVIGGREWKKLKKEIAVNTIGVKAGMGYWGADFINAAQAYFGTTHCFFADGTGKWNSTGKERYKAGKAYAEKELSKIVSYLSMNNGTMGSVCILAHSMGCAYAAGIISFLEQKGITVAKVVMLSPADPYDFELNTKTQTLQLSICNDVVLAYKNSIFKRSLIKGVQRAGIVKTARKLTEDFLKSHIDTKASPEIFNNLIDLEALLLVPAAKNFVAQNVLHQTQFKELYANGKQYTHAGTKDCYKTSLF